MNEFAQATRLAGQMLVSFDASLAQIIGLSLFVSLSATLLAVFLGVPLGGLLALGRFPGRRVLTVFVNAMMGLPPVVVGLILYLMLSRAGPLGALGLLYSPAAMILAQAVLVTPILAALSRNALVGAAESHGDLLRSMGLSRPRMLPVLAWEMRHSLAVAALAGFGRAIAEVGAVMIVGGNIAHATRVMTTAIATETSRGNLALALALGLVLMLLALLVNGAAAMLGGRDG